MKDLKILFIYLLSESFGFLFAAIFKKVLIFKQMCTYQRRLYSFGLRLFQNTLYHMHPKTTIIAPYIASFEFKNFIKLSAFFFAFTLLKSSVFDALPRNYELICPLQQPCSTFLSYGKVRSSNSQNLSPLSVLELVLACLSSII